MATTALLNSTVSAMVLEALKAGEIKTPVVGMDDPFWNYCMPDVWDNGTVYEWKTASPTGRVQNREPEYQRFGEYVSVRSLTSKIVETDLSEVESRVVAYLVDEFFSRELVKSVSTNQLPQEEPEPLTEEKLRRMMIEHGLMREPQTSVPYDWFRKWGMTVVQDKNRIFLDLETAT